MAFHFPASSGRSAHRLELGLNSGLISAQIHPGFQIPLNALLLVGVACALLALINIGSTTAFNALISLPLIALYVSYCISIAFLIRQKLHGRHPPYGPFKLGRWGVPTNLFSILYILYTLSFIALPTMMPVTGGNMNYAGPLVLAVIVIAIVDWAFSGRRRFHVPPLRLGPVEVDEAWVAGEASR